MLRSLFTEAYNAGNLKSQGLFHLLASVDASLDAPERPIALWPSITPHLAAQWWMHASVRTLSALRVPWRVTSWLVSEGVRGSVQIAASVVHANQEAMLLMRRYDIGDLWGGGEDLYFDAEMDRLLQLLRENVIEQVAAESTLDVKAAQAYLSAVRLAFPQLVMDVQTHHAAAALLHHKSAFVGQLHRAGVRLWVLMEGLLKEGLLKEGLLKEGVFEVGVFEVGVNEMLDLCLSMTPSLPPKH